MILMGQLNFLNGMPMRSNGCGSLIIPASEDAPFENHKECGTPSWRLMVARPVSPETNRTFSGTSGFRRSAISNEVPVV